jgi:TolA-binding protein
LFVINVVVSIKTKHKPFKKEKTMTFHSYELEIAQITNKENTNFLKKTLKSQIEKTENKIDKMQLEMILEYIEQIEKNADKINFAVEAICEEQNK